MIVSIHGNGYIRLICLFWFRQRMENGHAGQAAARTHCIYKFRSRKQPSDTGYEGSTIILQCPALSGAIPRQCGIDHCDNTFILSQQQISDFASVQFKF